MSTKQRNALPISLIDDALTVYRFEPNHMIPKTIWQAKFVTVSKTPEELSIVLSNDISLESGQQSLNWKAFYIDESLAHNELGILAHISATLAAAQCSIFAVSTYDTDYILVPADKVQLAIAALVETGKYFINASSQS